MRTLKLLSVPLILCLSLPAWSQQANKSGASEEAVDEITTIGVRERLYETGTLKDTIIKTEVVDESLIDSRQAVNLSEAIEASPGVRVSNECSMCGVKRLMLNGMRGEHTTILTDGIPLHTMMAGYYAVDAVATTGLNRIEIARGAGASLIAPEAIGGTINLVSREPDADALNVDAMLAEGDRYLLSGFGSLVSDDGRHRFSVVSQFDKFDRVDADDNGVSEAPFQANQNVIVRLSSDLTEKDNLTVRVGFTDSEIFGGPTSVDDIAGALATFDGVESDELFVDGDVRKQFIGSAWETTEWIDTERLEISGSWLREYNDLYNTTVTAAFSEHDQDSFYEGFDYAANDELMYLDFRNNFALSDKHLLTFGIDRRDERMRSQSVAGNESENYIEDSFDYEVLGLYIQDTWTPTDSLEIAAAIRIDSVEADFTAIEKPGVEIDKTVVAPRIDARYRHNNEWSSRISVGLGYRAPLSFFETDHGILDAGDGFAIDVDELEESLSTAYSLNFEGPRLAATLSLSHTSVENLASIDETEAGVPLLTQVDNTATVFSTDLALSYRLGDRFTLAGTAEQFSYDSDFESSYAVAPIEDRQTLSLDYDVGRWDFYASVIRVGERDLSKYGYEGFNVFDTVAKSTTADAYYTVDLKLSNSINDNLSWYIGAFNLLDETQVDGMESPLFWDADGGYDVAYIYGNLRSREVYLGVEFSM